MTSHTRIFVLFAAATLSVKIACGQGNRSVLGDGDIPKPEFFGIYAVQKGKIIELSKEKELELTTETEFLAYAAGVGSAEHLLLLRLDTQQAKARKARDEKRAKSGDQWRGWKDFMEVSQGENVYADTLNAQSGRPSGSADVPLRRKPFGENRDMIRLIPARELEPGVYQIGARGTPASEQAHFRVGFSRASATQESTSSNFNGDKTITRTVTFGDLFKSSEQKKQEVLASIEGVSPTGSKVISFGKGQWSQSVAIPAGVRVWRMDYANTNTNVRMRINHKTEVEFHARAESLPYRGKVSSFELMVPDQSSISTNEATLKFWK